MEKDFTPSMTQPPWSLQRPSFKDSRVQFLFYRLYRFAAWQNCSSCVQIKQCKGYTKAQPGAGTHYVRMCALRSRLNAKMRSLPAQYSQVSVSFSNLGWVASRVATLYPVYVHRFARNSLFRGTISITAQKGYLSGLKCVFSMMLMSSWCCCVRLQVLLYSHVVYLSLQILYIWLSAQLFGTHSYENQE